MGQSPKLARKEPEITMAAGKTPPAKKFKNKNRIRKSLAKRKTVSEIGYGRCSKT